MTGFVQVIEFRTTRIDEIRAFVEQLPDEDMGTARRGTITADRDRPDYYLNIVEFDSYDSAMANSARPEVSAFAAKMASLCEEPPRFLNLDVIESWSSETASPSKVAAVVGAATAAAGVAAASVAKARQKVEETRARGGRRPGVTSATGGPDQGSSGAAVTGMSGAADDPHRAPRPPDR